MSIMTVGAVLLARVLVVTTQANVAARSSAVGTLLTIDKLEELRAVPWGDARLSPSPTGALSVDTPGYVDYREDYVRRWSIEWSPVSTNVMVMQVVTLRRGGPDATRGVRTTSVRIRRGS